jgi:hypothetical protein
MIRGAVELHSWVGGPFRMRVEGDGSIKPTAQALSPEAD